MRSTPGSLFAPYLRGERLENEPVCTTSQSKGNPTQQLTAGIRKIFSPPPTAPGGPPTAAAQLLTLPDGRLNIGTHLPLLNGRYKYLATIGEGVSAQVLLVEDTFLPGQLVTIKAMRRQYSYAGQKEARALRFLHRRAASGHARGIVKLLGTFNLSGHFCIVTERLHPRFLDWVAESAMMPHTAALKAIKKIALQLLVSISFLHCQGVVHADLKPDNIMFAEPQGSHSVAIRLIDFGASLSTTETNALLVYEVQTLPYRSPEAALGLPAGKPMDLWSIGIILAEALLKRPLLPCSTPMELLKQMRSLLGPLPEPLLKNSMLGQQVALKQLTAAAPAEQSVGSRQMKMMELAAKLCKDAGKHTEAPRIGNIEAQSQGSPLIEELQMLDLGVADLIRSLLQYDPQKRITADQALEHPVFDDLIFSRMLRPLQTHEAPLATHPSTERATHIDPALLFKDSGGINGPGFEVLEGAPTGEQSTPRAEPKASAPLKQQQPTAAQQPQTVKSAVQPKAAPGSDVVEMTGNDDGTAVHASPVPDLSYEPAASVVGSDQQRKLVRLRKAGDKDTLQTTPSGAGDGNVGQERRGPAGSTGGGKKDRKRATSTGAVGAEEDDGAHSSDAGKRGKRGKGGNEKKPWWMV